MERLDVPRAGVESRTIPFMVTTGQRAAWFRRPLVLATAMLAAWLALGTAWYGLVEGFPALDALYQAVTTLTTVGFEEIRPLDSSGRIFTIVFILLGIGLLFYVAGAMVDQFLMGSLAELLNRPRNREGGGAVHGHFIICGFGRAGEAVAEELAAHRELIVVIDPDERRQAVALQHGYRTVPRTVLGDAARDATQREAAVERAKTLIAVTESDAVNTLITLTARSLNPEIFVAAGVRDDSTEAHLKQAGANRVFSLHRIAGRRIALAALQPMPVDFVDTEPVSGREYVQLLGELIVRDEGSALAGSTIGEAFAGLEATPVLAIERVNGELIKSPDASAAIQAGDRLLLYGDESEIEEIRATPRSRRLGVSPASG